MLHQKDRPAGGILKTGVNSRKPRLKLSLGVHVPSLKEILGLHQWSLFRNDQKKGF